MPDGALFPHALARLRRGLRDARVFSSDKKIEFRPKYGDAPLFEHHTTSLVFNDPPLHTHVRRAIQTALSTRVIAEMEAGLVALVDRLLDAMAREGPRRPDRGFRRRHSGRDHRQPARRAACGSRSAARLVARDPRRARAGADAEQMALGNDVGARFRRLPERAGRRPAPASRAIREKDVLTRLIRDEHEGSKLSETELLQNCIFILNAGHETTTNLIGNALDILIRFPAERRRLIENPALMKSAVEEVLRYESSNQLGNRDRHRRHRRSAACAMPKGTLVTIGIGAANRDPRAVPRSGPFRFARNPTRHLAFGSGIHHVRRHEPGAARRPHRDRAVSRALSGLRAGRRADAQPPRALSRLRVAAGASRDLTLALQPIAEAA